MSTEASTEVVRRKTPTTLPYKLFPTFYRIIEDTNQFLQRVRNFFDDKGHHTVKVIGKDQLSVEFGLPKRTKFKSIEEIVEKLERWEKLYRIREDVGDKYIDRFCFFDVSGVKVRREPRWRVGRGKGKVEHGVSIDVAVFATPILEVLRGYKIVDAFTVE